MKNMQAMTTAAKWSSQILIPTSLDDKHTKRNLKTPLISSCVDLMSLIHANSFYTGVLNCPEAVHEDSRNIIFSPSILVSAHEGLIQTRKKVYKLFTGLKFQLKCLNSLIFHHCHKGLREVYAHLLFQEFVTVCTLSPKKKLTFFLNPCRLSHLQRPRFSVLQNIIFTARQLQKLMLTD